MRVLFVITARGGSKGVPRKNVLQLGDYPLIAYKTIAAKKCKYEKRIIVSTDDREIAETAQKYGAEVPFMRPDELASDTAGSMDVLYHAVKWISEHDECQYDYVCLLEPTSPFLSYKDIESSMDMLVDSNADSMVSVKEVDVSSCFISPLDEEGRLSILCDRLKNMKSVRRQDQKKEYTLNGCIYAVKWNYFFENKTIYSSNCIPYIMPQIQSVDINNPFDVSVARCVLQNNLIDINLWK